MAKRLLSLWLCVAVTLSLAGFAEAAKGGRGGGGGGGRGGGGGAARSFSGGGARSGGGGRSMGGGHSVGGGRSAAPSRSFSPPQNFGGGRPSGGSIHRSPSINRSPSMNPSPSISPRSFGGSSPSIHRNPAGNYAPSQNRTTPRSSGGQPRSFGENRRPSTPAITPQVIEGVRGRSGTPQLSSPNHPSLQDRSNRGERPSFDSRSFGTRTPDLGNSRSFGSQGTASGHLNNRDQTPRNVIGDGARRSGGSTFLRQHDVRSRANDRTNDRRVATPDGGNRNRSNVEASPARRDTGIRTPADSNLRDRLTNPGGTVRSGRSGFDTGRSRDPVVRSGDSGRNFLQRYGTGRRSSGRSVAVDGGRSSAVLGRDISRGDSRPSQLTGRGDADGQRQLMANRRVDSREFWRSVNGGLSRGLASLSGSDRRTAGRLDHARHDHRDGRGDFYNRNRRDGFRGGDHHGHDHHHHNRFSRSRFFLGFGTPFLPYYAYSYARPWWGGWSGFRSFGLAFNFNNFGFNSFGYGWPWSWGGFGYPWYGGYSSYGYSYGYSWYPSYVYDPYASAPLYGTFDDAAYVYAPAVTLAPSGAIASDYDATAVGGPLLIDPAAIGSNAAVAEDPTLVANRDATVDEYAAEGEDHFRAGDYKQAARSWRHALVEDPKNPVLILMLSQALFASGEYAEAAGAVQQALRMLPEEDWGVVVANYTELYPRVGDYTTQLRALEAARKEKPEEPALRFLLGYHYAYLGYPKESVRELDKLLELAPRDVVGQRLRELMIAKRDATPEAPSAQPATSAPPSTP